MITSILPVFKDGISPSNGMFSNRMGRFRYWPIARAISTLTPAGWPLESSISNGGNDISIPTTNSFCSARSKEVRNPKTVSSKMHSFTKRTSILQRYGFQSRRSFVRSGPNPVSRLYNRDPDPNQVRCWRSGISRSVFDQTTGTFRGAVSFLFRGERRDPCHRRRKWERQERYRHGS